MALTQVNTIGITDATVANADLANEAVNEAKIQISNAGTNGQYLQKQSGNTGGLTWAAVNTDLVSDTSPQLGGDLETNGHNILLGDSSNGADDDVIRCGAGQDLNIYHDGTNSWIVNKTGDLNFYVKHGEYALRMLSDSGVELYYDNAKKFETTSTGVNVTDQLTVQGNINAVQHMYFPDNKVAYFGTGNDLQIFHDGTESYITNTTGNLYLNSKSGETAIRMIPDGAVKVYYNNTEKLTTSNNGVEVTRLGIGDDASSSHPLYVKHNQQYIAGIHNTASHASYYPWLLHKTVDSKQAFGIHFNGLAGDKFHVDQNGAVYLGGETAAANALDDYEEGTYTPNFTSGSGSFTHGTAQGRYVKIGQLVYCTFRVDWTGGSPTGAMFVSAPFTTTNSNPFGLTGAGGVSYNGSFNDAYSLTIGVQGNNSASAGKFYARSDDDTTYDPNPAGTGRCDGWMMFYT